ncbi:hypothetical protein Ddye_030393 [Dipteronia dyeriana]|uniref:Endonuclease/exonuclease/phosphatase domain-containing protein n=1 Tax=Dipteronia dyeriana TaxID=168575 RepID=A0AAD9TH05_9ROSI|nr:hypothetical protein Ddye_030393 [Dipteronia dyeriana]
MYNLPWLCMGDFNEIISEDDKLGGPPQNRLMMENFKEALEYCGFEDVGFRGPIFTWCNRRNGVDSMQERLDRGLCNIEWKRIFSRAFVQHLEFWHSDHRALLIDLSGPSNSWRNKGDGRRNRFHFEACWAEKDKCRCLIERSWIVSNGRDDLSDAVSNIFNCAKLLNEWNQVCRRNMVRDIHIKQNELLLATNLIIDESWNHIRMIESQLDSLLRCEEIYWKQRARTDWLREGDRNTNFFHEKASNRKSRNSIHGAF